MGWAYAGIDYYGREIGYGIVATCDVKGCQAVIDRGLGTICGDMHHGPFDDERGCGRYYCGVHLTGVGPRGGCSHYRAKKPWGKTKCQLMWHNEPTPEMDPATKRWKPSTYARFYCACHEWTFSQRSHWDQRPFRPVLAPDPDPVEEWEAHAIRRGFYQPFRGWELR